MRTRPLQICLVTGALVCFIVSARSQSLSGIRIGDQLTATLKIGSPPVAIENAGRFSIAKWVLADGNELSSATADTTDGKIVYIESDWKGKKGGEYTDIPNFYFGKTTLSQIRAALGSNGFAFPGREGGVARDNILYLFNSYEIESSNSVIVTFITKISFKEFGHAFKEIRAGKKNDKQNSDAEFTRIASNHIIFCGIILGQPEYLFHIWGTKLLFDPAYRKIQPDLLQTTGQEPSAPSRDNTGKGAASPSGLSAGADEVKLTDHGGTFLVPVRINDKLILDFVLDSGASDVQIPDDVLRTLYRTGTVSETDFLGTEMYFLADGSKVPSPRFMLRVLEVGNHKVNNVTASVGASSSEPLLGQSFLSKLGSWTLDNERHVLVLSDKSQR